VQIVLLAAGLGRRLGDLTREIPKALVPVAGDPLVVHALRFAARLGPSRVVVVGGFGFPKLAAELDRRRKGAGPEAALVVELVENPRFRDGNLLSLLAARDFLDDDFLITNVDHVFRGAIADVVRPEVGDITAFIDTERVLGPDDMKVDRDDSGRVRRISKTLDRFDAGYVGMTRVPRAACRRYLREADALFAAEGPGVHVERVLGRLAETDAPPLCRDLGGRGWLEVDTAEEKARAEEILRDPSWH
jgi:choline kinase